ncbi:3'-5' exonuclease [Paenibacillus albicereus]|jgi:DNA polymerase-3 subunit epsilon|uniref:3'-5' exonuclease n=1 Tax=Paenibacillus albicereus TaxID=2726185 RepID=A0A6H2GZQ8_9BACL|nr:3'-5' exonuclease [Paenibacillus albicereus]QJC52924.1 3'-5' exonuclease [Paenibacillus albicereus]
MLNDVTVFDFETSGLSPERDRVIEMAAVRIKNGQIVAEFSTLVRIDFPLAPKITELTGITPEMLTEATDETLAFKILRNLMGDSLLVAHNAAFDLQFLHHGMQRLAGKTFTNPFMDTLTICRDRKPYPHKLENMAVTYGIELDGAHRALNDVKATWELLVALHLEKPVDEWLNRLGYLSKYGPPTWAPNHAKLFGTSNRYAN